MPLTSVPPPMTRTADSIAAVLPITNGRQLSCTLPSASALAITSAPIPAGSPIVIPTSGLPAISVSSVIHSLGRRLIPIRRHPSRPPAQGKDDPHSLHYTLSPSQGTSWTCSMSARTVLHSTGRPCACAPQPRSPGARSKASILHSPDSIDPAAPSSTMDRMGHLQWQTEQLRLNTLTPI